MNCNEKWNLIKAIMYFTSIVLFLIGIGATSAILICASCLNMITTGHLIFKDCCIIIIAIAIIGLISIGCTWVVTTLKLMSKDINNMN